ncbi:hypothetical protein CRYPA_230 [uncultured Candidatus Thioglobus sp.]|nr:hypothetical protein CRYPA_230 [uncultured Candidatus Thioglobus sp.]
MASAKGGDCSSGAVGAVAAEIAGEMYAKNKDIASMSDKQREQLLTQTKLVAQLVAVASAELAGKDINSAFDAGTNAVENNLNSELRRKFIEADMYQLVVDGRLPQSTYDEVLKEIDAADKAGAEALVAYLSLMPVGQGVNLILQGGKEIIKRFGVDGLKKVVGKFTQLKKTNVSVYKKLDTYLLDKTHKDNKGKADFFKKALGFDRSNIDKLAKQIKFNPKTATQKSTTQYGTKYEQIIKIKGANGRLIDAKDGVMRLVTGYSAK